MEDVRIKVELEPRNPDVDSNVEVILKESQVLVKCKDCDESIMWIFKLGSEGIKKLERLRVALDLVEKHLEK